MSFNKNVDTCLDEIVNVENLITDIVKDDTFDKLIQNQERQNEDSLRTRANIISFDFVALDFSTLFDSVSISESDFLRIVGANKSRIYKKSGAYQERLYSNYLQALEEQDLGYLKDVFEKAEKLRDNIIAARALMLNRNFKREWRKNFGNISPVSVLRATGSMRQINIIWSLAQ